MSTCPESGEENYYHVFTKSIEGFRIFLSDGEYSRMFNAIRYYQSRALSCPLAHYLQQKKVPKAIFDKASLPARSDAKKRVEIIAYCFMPTHIHLLLKQDRDQGISNFMQLVLNSYSRYFNVKHKRKGPLWQGRAKKVLIESDEQLIHLTRYIHLNPVTANIVNKPEQWRYSSYGEYLQEDACAQGICSFRDVLDIKPNHYREFVNDRIGYQKELARIKRLTLEPTSTCEVEVGC